MKPFIIYGLLALVFIWYNLYLSNSIVNYLKQHQKEASLFDKGGLFVRGKIFKYLPIFKNTSLKVEGKVHSNYHLFYLSFFLYLFFLILGLANL